MTVIVDSCGWIEYLTDGPLAPHYAKVLEGGVVVVPTIVLYEVYKLIKRTAGEERAMVAASHLSTRRLVPLDETLALEAADAALAHGLAMADATVYATARRLGAELVTSDADLQGLPGVRFIEHGRKGA